MQREEDGPPNVRPPLEPENSTRKTDPSPVSEPFAAEPSLTDLLKVIKESDARLANWVGSFREVIRDEIETNAKKQRSELETVFGTLSQAIGDSERRVVEAMNHGFADLDRRAEKRHDDLRGAVSELAKKVSDYHLVSQELQARGYELERSAAGADDEQSQDRDTQVDIAEAGQ